MKKPNKWHEFLRRPEEAQNKQWAGKQNASPPQRAQQVTRNGQFAQTQQTTTQATPTTQQTTQQRQQQRQTGVTTQPSMPYSPRPCPPQPCPPCPPYPPGPIGPPDRRCYPFDAFGLASCTPPVDLVDPSLGIEIPLMINVTIPTGFVLPQGVSYMPYLSVDRSALSTGIFTQYFVCTTTNDPVNPNTQMVKSQVARLTGTVYYNLTLRGFMPAQPINDTQATPITCINKAGYLDLEYILAYLQPTDTLIPGYTIEARMVNTSLDGDLQNPSTERTLIFNFVLKIQAVMPEQEVPSVPSTPLVPGTPTVPTTPTTSTQSRPTTSTTTSTTQTTTPTTQSTTTSTQSTTNIPTINVPLPTTSTTRPTTQTTTPTTQSTTSTTQSTTSTTQSTTNIPTINVPLPSTTQTPTNQTTQN